MATTGYIVWDAKNKKFMGGPFLSSAEATTFLNRLSKRTDSRESSNKSKDQSAQFTTETVTLN